MIGANVEIITDDETHVLYRISWYAGGEHFEKWVTKRKDELEEELEDEEFP